MMMEIAGSRLLFRVTGSFSRLYFVIVCKCRMDLALPSRVPLSTSNNTLLTKAT